ncbi:2-hydroxyacid dehydrogenase [Streptomyces sp. MBT53]|uniref:2-hydroxyacid dehydrogenase n=1 Tax=Streptomyces sp. MBT53 TaxID=1488384 RepID=UPI001F29AB8C|nr:NAD(P)-dependent oxidoreductase [Streptomyces sp. MBT53]
MTSTKNVLAVVPPHIGGRTAGAGLATLLPDEVHVTVVEAVDEDTALVDGDWALPRLQSSLTELSGKTLGIMGLGAIGQQVARRAAAFDMTVVYAGRRPVPEETTARLGGARHVPLDELLRLSDYVTLHTPLTDETRHLLNAERLALLKPTAFIVNTARGALIERGVRRGRGSRAGDRQRTGAGRHRVGQPPLRGGAVADLEDDVGAGVLGGRGEREP